MCFLFQWGTFTGYMEFFFFFLGGGVCNKWKHFMSKKMSGKTTAERIGSGIWIGIEGFDHPDLQPEPSKPGTLIHPFVNSKWLVQSDVSKSLYGKWLEINKNPFAKLVVWSSRYVLWFYLIIYLPSWELTYPLPRHFSKCCSFSQGGICWFSGGYHFF